MLFFLYKRLNRHNYTLKIGHQGGPTTLNVYVKIMYIENLFYDGVLAYVLYFEKQGKFAY